MNLNNSPLLLDSPRVWRTYLGGSKLDELHGKVPSDGHYPEEWICSIVAARNPGHPSDEGLSRTSDGHVLRDLISSDPSGYLGSRFADVYGATTGVLVKLIDAGERLTLQVHPDRETAMRLFGSPFGKTECWHILDTRGSACIYYGFKQHVTRALWKDLFDRQDIGSMLDAMESFPVRKGDTFLIEGGIPHAIGEGCFLVEIQEPTDYTIRVERTTPSGFHVDDQLCHQGLGFDRMFDVFDYTPRTRMEICRKGQIPPGLWKKNRRTLVGYDRTPFFQLEEIRGDTILPASDVFYGLYVLSGCGTLHLGYNEWPLLKTSQLFIPADAGEVTLTSSPGTPLSVLRFFGPRCP